VSIYSFGYAVPTPYPYNLYVICLLGAPSSRRSSTSSTVGRPAKKSSSTNGGSDPFSNTAIYKGGIIDGNSNNIRVTSGTTSSGGGGGTGGSMSANERQLHDAAEREANDFLQMERLAHQQAEAELLAANTAVIVAAAAATTMAANNTGNGRPKRQAVVWADDSPPSTARSNTDTNSRPSSQVSGGVADARNIAATATTSRKEQKAVTSNVPRFDDESEWEDMNAGDQSEHDVPPVAARAPIKKQPLGPAAPRPRPTTSVGGSSTSSGSGLGKMQHSPVRPVTTSSATSTTAGPPQSRTRPHTAPNVLDDDNDDYTDDAADYDDNNGRSIGVNGARAPLPSTGGLFPRSNKQYSLSDHDRPSEPPLPPPKLAAAKAKAARGSNKGSSGSTPNSPSRGGSSSGRASNNASSAIPKPKQSSLKGSGSAPSVAKKTTAAGAAKKAATAIRRDNDQSSSVATTALTSGCGISGMSGIAASLVGSSDSERIAEMEARLRRMAHEQEMELKFIRQESALKKKQLADAEAEFKAYKLKEGKKLRREREELEKQTKRVLALPDRKEREQTELLRDELAAVKRELKQKEQRWKVNDDRLKSQVQSLQMENRQLREEIKIAEGERLKEWEEKEKKWKIIIEEKVKRDLLKKDAKRRELAADIDARMGRPILMTSDDDHHQHEEQDGGADDNDDGSNGAPLLIEHHQPHTIEEEEGENEEDEPEFDLADHDNDMRVSQRTSGRTSRPQSATSQQQQQQRPLSASAGARPTTAISTGGGRPTDDTVAGIRIERHLPRVSPKKEGGTGMGHDGSSSSRGGGSGATSARHHVTTPLDLLLPGGAHTNDNMIDGVHVIEEVDHGSGKVEKRLADGSRMVIFRNGTIRRTYGDGRVGVNFSNGDKKEVFADKKVVYYYAQNNTTHITQPDGIQVHPYSLFLF
jgi:hypothetical protein